MDLGSFPISPSVLTPKVLSPSEYILPSLKSSSIAFPFTCTVLPPLLIVSAGVKFALLNPTGVTSPLPVIFTPRFLKPPIAGATIPPPTAPARSCLPLVSIIDSSSTYPVAPAMAPDTIPYLPIV